MKATTLGKEVAFVADDTAGESKRERNRQAMRRWRQANPEKALEGRRRYYAENRERYLEMQRERRRKRSEERQQHQAGLRRSLTPREKMARTHGPNWAAAFAAFWAAQAACCYLCGDPLEPDVPQAVVIDHDHQCCGQRRSCEICRRGLACGRCNRLVGLADESPDRLRRIAEALATANAKVQARLTSRAVQEAMFEIPEAG